MDWQSAVETTVTGLGYDLVDTERSPGGLLRVYIDRVAADPNGEFINVDDCEKVTRQLQHVLEVEGCAYERLEVSSPGLDRPLKRAADYVRFAGLQVDVTLKVPFQGRKKYRGTLQPQDAAEPEAAGNAWRLIYTVGEVEQALEFVLQEVREARLVAVVDFKGRRFSKQGDATAEGLAPVVPSAGDEIEGDRIQ